MLFEVAAGAPGRRGKACRVRARVGAASLSVGVMLLALAGCDDMHDCSEAITHYRVLATIEAAYGLPRDGHAAAVAPITDIWRS